MFPLLTVFLFAIFTTLRAQDAPGDYPTGPSGDFNGEVATAGSYDPFTQNAKRAIPDLVVPGSNGAYPLALTRIYNSQMQRLVGESLILGDGGNWRHSYMWALSAAEVSGGTVNAYDVAYPDGGIITFRPGRSYVSSNEYSTYWRGPVGTQDRLEVTSGRPLCLHRSDGGLVYFATDFYANSQHATLIVDSFGAATALYYNNGLLSQVTEPGGRCLYFDYSTVTETVQGGGFTQNYTWVLLAQVRASTGQSVSYAYSEVGGRSQYGPWSVPYKVLTNVTYNAEPSTSGSGNVQASYTYEYKGGGIPIITTAYDPHYMGAMVGIRYAYTSTGSGLILEEKNLNTNERVSNLNWGSASGPVVTTETRGDKASGGGNIQRIISYREPYVNGVATNTNLTQLTSYSDFQGNRTYLTYCLSE